MSENENSSRNISTTLIHGDAAVQRSHSVAPPIYQTSTFSADSAEAYMDMSLTPHHQAYYARYGNPNHEQAEAVIAQLEGAESALVTSSGMGAFSTLILALMESGAHVIAQEVHYGGVTGFLNKMAKFGIETTYVDQRDPQQFADAIRPNTQLILTETPGNPSMAITDLAAVAAIGKQHGIITLCDNTFATPINQRPLDFGIDIVWHSATKYLGGHHDLIAGAIASSQDMIERIWRWSISAGAVLNGFDSWLLLRGMRTLALRVKQHNETALKVAAFLESHPKVAYVYYPGLPSHPQHELAAQQMSGFGGMLSFELDADTATTDRFIDSLQYSSLAASLGGIHSLITRPAAMLAAVMSEAEFEERGIAPKLVRLSVGLEDAEDLIADLQANLDAL